MDKEEVTDTVEEESDDIEEAVVGPEDDSAKADAVFVGKEDSDSTEGTEELDGTKVKVPAVDFAQTTNNIATN